MAQGPARLLRAVESPPPPHGVPTDPMRPAPALVLLSLTTSLPAAAGHAAEAESGGVAAPGEAIPVPDDRLGLFEAERFVAVEGSAAEGLAPAGVWHFREEWIAVPAPERSEAAEASAASLPPLVWLAAPELIERASLGEDRVLTRPDGRRAALDVVPPLEANRLYVDDSTFEFFGRREVRLRGTTESAPAGERFVARTIWPLDARIRWADLEVEPLTPPESLTDLIRAQVPRLPDARLLWERERSGPREWAGRPVLAVVLSGSQADAPGSHAGHIAIATGRLGAGGEWAGWLANDIYPIAAVGAKGILPGTVTMDNYLADLNSGQAMYRPVYVVAAVLDAPEAALAVQARFDDFFLRYWCRQVEYHHARRNSTELSLDVFRELGWRLPRMGGTSRLMGALAAVGTLILKLDGGLARDAWNYFTKERTDIFPRLAFETVAGDLLALVGDTPPRPPNAFEAQLAAATDGILFLRFPQIPSSRPTGTFPVGSVREYRSRVGLGEAADVDPVPPAERPLPEPLRAACDSDPGALSAPSW